MFGWKSLVEIFWWDELGNGFGVLVLGSLVRLGELGWLNYVGLAEFGELGLAG